MLVSSSPAGIVTQTYAELQRNSATTVSVSGLTAVVAGLSRAPGRKSLVLFTEGVAISRNTDPYFYALIDQANRANVAIYTVDSVGLRAEDPILMAGRQVHSQTREDDGNLSTRGFDLGDAARAMPDVGLTILADQTGGQMFNASNDLFKAFPRLDEDLRSYYAVTYAAPRAEPDRRFHKIDVKVKRPGLSAKTRSGYTSLPAATGSMPVLAYEAPALARLDSTPLPNELPIMARALVFPVTPEAANVPVLVSVPANVLDYTRDDAAGTFAAEAVVLTRIRDDRGQVVHKASEQYTLNGKVEGLEASRAGELLFYRQPQLAPGVYTFEAIVMDTHSGKASVRISSLEVARTTGNTLRVGTPFIVRRAEPASASAADAGNPLYFGDVLLYPNLGQPLSKDTDKELAFGFTAYDGHGESIEGSLEILRIGPAARERGARAGGARQARPDQPDQQASVGGAGAGLVRASRDLDVRPATRDPQRAVRARRVVSGRPPAFGYLGGLGPVASRLPAGWPVLSCSRRLNSARSRSASALRPARA